MAETLGERFKRMNEPENYEVLICCNCGRLWADDDDGYSESCSTPGCNRFKQRMEWATAQQIEDADTKHRETIANLQSQLTAARERIAELESQLRYADERWRNLVRISESGPRTRKDAP